MSEKPWQEHAISWLRLQAAEQACRNASSPDHARAYENWRNIVKYATRFAEDLERQYARETHIDPGTAEYESWSHRLSLTEAQERERFEAWFAKDGTYEPEWLNFNRGMYESADTENMWQAWLARASLPTPQAATQGEAVAQLRQALQNAKPGEVVNVPPEVARAIENEALLASMPELLEIRKREQRGGR